MSWTCVAPLPQVLAACDEQPVWLSVAEQQRWAMFSTAARRRQFVAGRWLARRLLARVAGGDPDRLELGVGSEGRSAAPAPWSVCISHSGDWVGAAVARGEAVGFDVQTESSRHDWQALANFAGLQPCPDSATFYRHWTLAEAWLKAHADIHSLTALRGLRWQPAAAGPAWQGQTAALHWACVSASAPQWVSDLFPGSLDVEPGQAWAPVVKPA